MGTLRWWNLKSHNFSKLGVGPLWNDQIWSQQKCSKFSMRRSNLGGGWWFEVITFWLQIYTSILSPTSTHLTNDTYGEHLGVNCWFLTTFLAKLFRQLCSCHWNGNYDLFSNFVTFSALLWPFYDLFSNFMTFLWPLWPFYDLFSTFVTFLWTTKKVTILWTTKWYYLDLIVTFCDLFMTFSALLWPFCEWQKVTILWITKWLLSRSNYNLFMNDTI